MQADLLSLFDEFAALARTREKEDRRILSLKLAESCPAPQSAHPDEHGIEHSK